MPFTQAEVEASIERALGTLHAKDMLLLEIDANERSISHKLAEYLQAEFPDWDIDCEYNRRGDLPKRLIRHAGQEVPRNDEHARTVFPDIIIHHRKTTENIVVIEIKKSTNSEDRNLDEEKLRAFLDDPNYRYDHAYFIEFRTGPHFNRVQPYEIRRIAL